MKTTKEVKLGRLYLCKVRGKFVKIRVINIDTSGYKKHSTVRMTCVVEETGDEIIVRAPSRLTEVH